MSHIGNERDWNSLVEYFINASEYIPTLKRVMLAQWVYSSRESPDAKPGTSELAINACNYANVVRNPRMASWGAGSYELNGTTYCSFEDVEHFVEGFLYFITSGPYQGWLPLVHRPYEFLKHLQTQGFAGNNTQYTEGVRTISEHIEDFIEIESPDIQAASYRVSEGDYIYKIASGNGTEIENVFSVDSHARVNYGSNVGIIHPDDLLFIIDGDQATPPPASDPILNLPTCNLDAGDCAGRTHFVLHQTVAGNLTRKSITERYGGLRNKAHVYILKSGEAVFLWPFTEKKVRATKSEYPEVAKYKPLKGSFPGFPIFGKLIHVEIDYEDLGRPNESQYQTLVQLYIDACKTVGRTLTIVPHIEIDRGIRNGHNDPQNFDYEHFYELLANAGINVNRIPKFSHNRYWAKENYRTPFDTDTFHFPPVLAGNPHS